MALVNRQSIQPMRQAMRRYLYTRESARVRAAVIEAEVREIRALFPDLTNKRRADGAPAKSRRVAQTTRVRPSDGVGRQR